MVPSHYIKTAVTSHNNSITSPQVLPCHHKTISPLLVSISFSQVNTITVCQHNSYQKSSQLSPSHFHYNSRPNIITKSHHTPSLRHQYRHQKKKKNSTFPRQSSQHDDSHTNHHPVTATLVTSTPYLPQHRHQSCHSERSITNVSKIWQRRGQLPSSVVGHVLRTQICLHS